MTILNLVRESLRTSPRVMERLRFPELNGRKPHYSAERVAALLQHKETLLREAHHRVGNSLQIIASILAIDARKVHSAEARLHLESAHRRILAVAAVQQQLLDAPGSDRIELAAYLRQLCEKLAVSIVRDTSRIAIEVRADTAMVTSAMAMSFGLVVTELVINALKHGFVGERATGRILISYRVEGRGWRLTVSDNGVGKSNGDWNAGAACLGTGIVAVLVRQLEGRVEILNGPNALGTSVTIIGRIAGSPGTKGKQ